MGHPIPGHHTKADNIPVDFVSTHVYANDKASVVFGTNEDIPRDKMVWRSRAEEFTMRFGAFTLPQYPR